MRTQQSGFTMIEVLVTIGILVVGLLGLAALQTLTTVSELEAYQRAAASASRRITSPCSSSASVEA